MRLRKSIPFVLVIGVLLVAACAPVTPVIPQTGPDTQITVMPGDNGQGSTGGTTGGQEGTGTNQNGTGTNQGGSGTNQGGSGTNQGGTTDGNQGGTGSGGTGTGSTGSGNNQGGTGSSGGIIGGQGGFGSGNTAPSPSGSQNSLNQNLQNAVSGFVTQQSGGAASDVEILFAQQVDFQNGCLGLTDQGETCSQAVTPGWQVVARSNGNLYVVHVDSNGKNVRWNQNADANAIMGSGTGTDGNQGGTDSGNNQGGQSGGNGGSSGGSNQGGVTDGGVRVGLDQVINLASQFLGQTLNVPVNQVSFSGVSVETWSDSCLGVGQANESCAQVTTPGYRISFNVGGQTYELRTDSTGSNMRLVQGGQQ